MSKTNEDRNIYVLYEKGTNNAKEIQWKDYKFDLSNTDSSEVYNFILGKDSSFETDYNNGLVKIIKRNIEPKTTYVTKPEASDMSEEEIDNIPVPDSKENDTLEENNISNVHVSDNFKKWLAAGVAVALVATTAVIGVAHYNKYLKNKDKDKLVEGTVTLSNEESEVTKTAKKAVENSLDNFSTLSSKYMIDGKQFGLTAEEWLTAYIYANSKDLTFQELVQIIKDNPDFYVNLADNYRSWCKTQMEYNIVADETSLTKDVFENEEAYDIYMNYYDLYQKTKKDPTAENKKALEELTKNIYGATASLNDIDSVWEQYPGVASVLGHTVVTSARTLQLITKDTYDYSMGIYNYDKNGNLVETHGPIEIATCEMIENEILNKINAFLNVDVEQDLLKEWFDELNKKHYDSIQDKLITEEIYLNYLNKLLEERLSVKTDNNNYVNQNPSSSTSSSVKVQEEITRSEAVQDYGEKEVSNAESKADEVFEEEYGEKIEQQEAKKQGLLDANDLIENILVDAERNEKTADSYTANDIKAIGKELVNNYTGNYKSYYTEGVNEAVASGISVLLSVQKQYDDRPAKTEDVTSSESSNSSSSSSEPDNVTEEDDFVETPSDEEVYIPQEELDEIVGNTSATGLCITKVLNNIKNKLLNRKTKKLTRVK